MFERFSPEARDAVSRAGDEARALGHGHIGTEHLLLGLIGATGTASSEALISAGAFLLPAREKVIEALAGRSARSSAGTGADLPYTDRAARALDRSGKLALRMGSEQVRCEHILLSLLDVEGTAGQVLRGLGADPEVVRNLVLSPPPTSAAPAGAPAGAEGRHRRRPDPICASCGSGLRTSLGRATIAIAGGQPADQADVYFCTVCGTAVGARRR
jgi:hypothetical protein